MRSVLPPIAPMTHSRRPRSDGNVANAAKAGKRFFGGVAAIDGIARNATDGSIIAVSGNDDIDADARDDGVAGNAGIRIVRRTRILQIG